MSSFFGLIRQPPSAVLVAAAEEANDDDEHAEFGDIGVQQPAPVIISDDDDEFNDEIDDEDAASDDFVHDVDADDHQQRLFNNNNIDNNINNNNNNNNNDDEDEDGIITSAASQCSGTNRHHHNNHTWRGWRCAQTNLFVVRSSTANTTANNNNSTLRRYHLHQAAPAMHACMPTMPVSTTNNNKKSLNATAAASAGGRGVLALNELAARSVATYLPFEIVDNYCRVHQTPMPEELQRKIAYWSFPENEEDIRLYSTLANGSDEQYLAGEQLALYPNISVKNMMQIGFQLTAAVSEITMTPAQQPQQQQNASFLAAVASSSGRYYDVCMTFDRKRITSCSCTCEMPPSPAPTHTSWCRHIVAVCLARMRHAADKLTLRAPISESLVRLDRDQIHKAFQYLVNELPAKYLPHAQRLLDDLLHPTSSINQTDGAADRTAGASVDDISAWWYEPERMRLSLRTLLHKFCQPSPQVFSDVGYLCSSAQSTAAAEWSNLMRPLRGREPEGLWNLFGIVREMLKRGDSNATALLKIISEDCLQHAQIPIWWFNVRTSHYYGGSGTIRGTAGGGNNSSTNTSVTQHACASFMDEIADIWRLAALNPTLTDAERLKLLQELCVYHNKLFELVAANRAMLKSVDINIFAGFRAAIEAAQVDWHGFSLCDNKLMYFVMPPAATKSFKSSKKSSLTRIPVLAASSVTTLVENGCATTPPATVAATATRKKTKKFHKKKLLSLPLLESKQQQQNSKISSDAVDTTIHLVVNGDAEDAERKNLDYDATIAEKQPSPSIIIGEQNAVEEAAVIGAECKFELMQQSRCSSISLTTTSAVSISSSGGSGRQRRGGKARAFRKALRKRSAQQQQQEQQQQQQGDAALAVDSTLPVRGDSPQEGMPTNSVAENAVDSTDSVVEAVSSLKIDADDNSENDVIVINAAEKSKNNDEHAGAAIPDNVVLEEKQSVVEQPHAAPEVINIVSSSNKPKSTKSKRSKQKQQQQQQRRQRSSSPAPATTTATELFVGKKKTSSANNIAQQTRQIISTLKYLPSISSSSNNNNNTAATNTIITALAFRKPVDKLEILFMRAEALYSHGFTQAALHLASQLAQQLLSNLTASAAAAASVANNVAVEQQSTNAVICTDAVAPENIYSTVVIQQQKPPCFIMSGSGVLVAMNDVDESNTASSSSSSSKAQRLKILACTASMSAYSVMSKIVFLLQALTSHNAVCGDAVNNVNNQHYTYDAFRIGLQGLMLARPAASSRALEVRLSSQEQDVLHIMKTRLPITSTTAMRSGHRGDGMRQELRQLARKLQQQQIERGGALLPLSLANYIFDQLCLNNNNSDAVVAAPNRRRPPTLSDNNNNVDLDADDETLGFEAALAALGRKATTITENDAPLLCEGTRRQRGELALLMLAHYRDNERRLAHILDHFLDRDIHSIFRCDQALGVSSATGEVRVDEHMMSTFYANSCQPKSVRIVLEKQFRQCAQAVLPPGMFWQMPTLFESIMSGGGLYTLQQQQQQLNTNAGSAVPQSLPTSSSTASFHHQQQQQQESLNNNNRMFTRQNSTNSVASNNGNNINKAAEFMPPPPSYFYAGGSRDSSSALFNADDLAYFFSSFSSPSSSSSSLLLSNNNNVLNNLTPSSSVLSSLKPLTCTVPPCNSLYYCQLFASINCGGLPAHVIFSNNSRSKHQQPCSSSQQQENYNNNGFHNNDWLLYCEEKKFDNIHHYNQQDSACTTSARNAVKSASTPIAASRSIAATSSSSNRPTDALAYFMFEFAKTLLGKAGGSATTSIFHVHAPPVHVSSNHHQHQQQQNNNNNHILQQQQQQQRDAAAGVIPPARIRVAPHVAPPPVINGNINFIHRGLQMCAFQVALYALGVNNRVTPNWLNRTYYGNIAWLQQQAVDIGTVAINFLTHTWEGHLTPTEAAHTADLASRSADRDIVRAAAFLAQSTLVHAANIARPEILRALDQCQEQSHEMLEEALLCVESATTASTTTTISSASASLLSLRSGVSPETLMDVARRWYNLYYQQQQHNDAAKELLADDHNDNYSWWMAGGGSGGGSRRQSMRRRAGAAGAAADEPVAAAAAAAPQHYQPHAAAARVDDDDADDNGVNDDDDDDNLNEDARIAYALAARDYADDDDDIAADETAEAAAEDDDLIYTLIGQRSLWSNSSMRSGHHHHSSNNNGGNGGRSSVPSNVRCRKDLLLLGGGNKTLYHHTSHLQRHRRRQATLVNNAAANASRVNNSGDGFSDWRNISSSSSRPSQLRHAVSSSNNIVCAVNGGGGGAGGSSTSGVERTVSPTPIQFALQLKLQPSAQRLGTAAEQQQQQQHSSTFHQHHGHHQQQQQSHRHISAATDSSHLAEMNGSRNQNFYNNNNQDNKPVPLSPRAVNSFMPPVVAVGVQQQQQHQQHQQSYAPTMPSTPAAAATVEHVNRAVLPSSYDVNIQQQQQQHQQMMMMMPPSNMTHQQPMYPPNFYISSNKMNDGGNIYSHQQQQQQQQQQQRYPPPPPPPAPTLMMSRHMPPPPPPPPPQYNNNFPSSNLPAYGMQQLPSPVAPSFSAAVAAYASPYGFVAPRFAASFPVSNSVPVGAQLAPPPPPPGAVQHQQHLLAQTVVAAQQRLQAAMMNMEAVMSADQRQQQQQYAPPPFMLAASGAPHHHYQPMPMTMTIRRVSLPAQYMPPPYYPGSTVYNISANAVARPGTTPSHAGINSCPPPQQLQQQQQHQQQSFFGTALVAPPQRPIVPCAQSSSSSSYLSTNEIDEFGAVSSSSSYHQQCSVPTQPSTAASSSTSAAASATTAAARCFIGQDKHLLAAYRVGMLAMETLTSRVFEDRYHVKYHKTKSPFCQEVLWLLEKVVKKLGLNFLPYFISNVLEAVASPFVLFRIAYESALYLAAAERMQQQQHAAGAGASTAATVLHADAAAALVRKQFRSSILCQLMLKCMQMFQQCLIQKIHHIGQNEYDEFVDTIQWAQMAYYIMPQGHEQFQLLLKMIKCDPSCKRELWSRVTAAVAQFHAELVVVVVPQQQYGGSTAASGSAAGAGAPATAAVVPSSSSAAGHHSNIIMRPSCNSVGFDNRFNPSTGASAGSGAD